MTKTDADNCYSFFIAIRLTSFEKKKKISLQNLPTNENDPLHYQVN